MYKEKKNRSNPCARARERDYGLKEIFDPLVESDKHSSMLNIREYVCEYEKNELY